MSLSNHVIYFTPEEPIELGTHGKNSSDRFRGPTALKALSPTNCDHDTQTARKSTRKQGGSHSLSTKTVYSETSSLAYSMESDRRMCMKHLKDDWRSTSSGSLSRVLKLLDDNNDMTPCQKGSIRHILQSLELEVETDTPEKDIDPESMERIQALLSTTVDDCDGDSDNEVQKKDSMESIPLTDDMVRKVSEGAIEKSSSVKSITTHQTNRVFGEYPLLENMFNHVIMALNECDDCCTSVIERYLKANRSHNSVSTKKRE